MIEMRGVRKVSRWGLLLALCVLVMGPGSAKAGIFGKKQEAEEEQEMSLKERKEKIKAEENAALAAGKRKKIKRKPIKTVGQRLRVRGRGFKRVKNREGLSSVLFPGVSPEEFYEEEDIPMWMNDVTSEQAAQIPYGYYDLPVCPGPTAQATLKLRKNLGAKLQGHTLTPSPYRIEAGLDMPCTPVCEVKINPRSLLNLRKLIDRRYRIHATLDSLPVLVQTESKYTVRGYPLGFKAPPALTGLNRDEFYLYNHIKFVVRYREDPEDFEGMRIVGFEAAPVSIDHDLSELADDADISEETELPTCMEGVKVKNTRDTLLRLSFQYTQKEEVKKLVDKQGGRIPDLRVVYSYEVEWVPSDITWANRWDIYMSGSPDDKIHYFSILNSLTVVLILSVIVATVMIRTLRKDIKYYNEQFDLAMGDGGTGVVDDESGWKLLHGDVFRAPAYQRKLLCLATGVGMQLVTVTVLTIVCSLFGFLGPMDKGQTLTAFIVLYVLSSGVAGYVSSRMFKFFEDGAWKKNTIVVAVAFPGALVSIFLVLDICLAFVGSSSAVSIWTIFALFLLWVCVSIPLVFVGSYLGYRAKKVDVPVKTNQIARAVPPTDWYIRPPASYLIGGFLPFASAVLEIFFIMNAMWLHQIYYVMGFLLIVVFIVAVTCAQVSVVFCYLQLCGEDHRWWWRSFLNSGSAGLYLMMYSIWFATSKLHLVGFLPALIYLSYMLILSMAFAMICGSIGLISTFFFVKKIYGAIKVD